MISRLIMLLNFWTNILYRVDGTCRVTYYATRLFTLLYCRLHPSVLQSFYYSAIRTHTQHEISSCRCPLSANSLLKNSSRELPRTIRGGLLPRTLSCSSQSHIATDGQSVSKSWCRAPFGAYDQIFSTVWQLRYCFFCGAPSRQRGRVCLLSESLPALVFFFIWWGGT
jgi:hypothetical protein